MQKPAHLLVVDQFGVKKKLPLDKRVFTIGRRPANDLVLLSSSVSRDHGAIVYEDERYFLVDKGSKGGLFINGAPVSRQELRHQDRIVVGGDDDSQIEFLDDAAPVIFSSSEGLHLSQVDHKPSGSANEELQRLARYVEINQAFKFSLTPDDVLCLIVDAAIEMAGAERGCLLLKNDAGQLEFRIARDSKRNLLEGNDFKMSQSVVTEAFKENRTVVVVDTPETINDQRHSVYNLSLRSIVCVPLRHFQMSEKLGQTSILKNTTTGVLYVDSQNHHGAFSPTSLKLLESLAFEASKSLESVRLMHEEQTKKKLEQELSTAREVQVALLPTRFIHPSHFEVAAHSLPCRYVGGDFYDLLKLDDDRSALILGDVSGKGISAALLAAMSQGIIQALFDSALPLSDLLKSLNRVLVRKSEANRFLTLFCALIDADGKLTFANAGHNPAILAHANGEIELLSTGSMLLGAFEDVSFVTTEQMLMPGDVLVIFSDGVTEAVNSASELFGDKRLEELISKNVRLSAGELWKLIEKEVVSFTSGLPQSDDITLIVLKMKGVDQFEATLVPESMMSH